jgi:glycosyltransferase involved in cell wall biosynthesis
MNVLFVTPYMVTGGTEKIVYKLARGLDEEGLQVGVASTGGYLADSLEKEGITIHRIASLNRRTPVPLSKASHSLGRILRETRYDVINSHSFITAVVCWFAICMSRSRTKHIFTLHIPENTSHYNIMGLSLNILADHIITVCNYSMKELIKHGLKRNKCSIIYNGVDCKEFPIDTKRFCRDKIVIGIIARLIQRKGHIILFKSVQKLREKYNLEIHVIGDGPNRESLERAVREMGLHNAVIFWGDRRDIPERMRELDIFVLPSFYEGFPVTILEALSSGVPVIASAVDGIPEIIEDGANGLMVRPGDSDALATAIESVIVDESLRNTVKENGRRVVEEKFTVSHMIDSYQKHFRLAG